jgi:predicted ATPase
MVRDLDQPFNQALVSAYLALLQQLRARERVAREYAERAYELSDTYQAPYYRDWAHVLVTHASALERPDDAHIARMLEAIATFTTLGARLRLPYYLALLAEVYVKAGRPEEGLETVERGLAHAREYGERWWDAELHRLRGELLVMRESVAMDAEAAFARAIKIAQAQRAKSLELRATLSLARLWRGAGRADAARQRLAEIYDWFTEGFDTPDLLDARRLLAKW